MGDVLGCVAALTRTDAVGRHVTLVFDAGPDLPMVIAYGVHLQQVVLNLVMNAMDAIDGSFEGERRVVVQAQQLGGRAIEVMVSDSGPAFLGTTGGHFRSVLHHEAQRHGHRNVHFAHHRRSTRWAHLGGEQCERGRRSVLRSRWRRRRPRERFGAHVHSWTTTARSSLVCRGCYGQRATRSRPSLQGRSFSTILPTRPDASSRTCGCQG